MRTAENPPRRVQSFLAPAEQRLVRAMVVGLPEHVTPLELTKLSVFGAVAASVALVGCRWSPLWLSLFIVGVLLNWFGATLDGSLAVYRKEESPQRGFVEHLCDLFSMILIIVTFGASPFLSWRSAFLVLLCFLLFSAYTYIRAAARHIQQMAYIGIGATEFRILMIVWAFVAHALELNEKAIVGSSRVDTAIAALAIIAIGGLVIKIISEGRRIAVEEQGLEREPE